MRTPVLPQNNLYHTTAAHDPEHHVLIKENCSNPMLSLHSRCAADPENNRFSRQTVSVMPDLRDINAWMGHCGGTDPYCQQGCSPACGNYTYRTGIEIDNSCKDPVAGTLVGKYGNRGNGQPRVGQRTVQEAMRMVQGNTQARTQRTLPQHQARFEARTPDRFENLRTVNSGALVSRSSLVTASNEPQSAKSSTLQQQQKLVSSTAETAPQDVVENEDEDAEYEDEELQRCRWEDVPKRPLGPIQQRVSWESST